LVGVAMLRMPKRHRPLRRSCAACRTAIALPRLLH